jgi:hypothetical protein
MFDYKVEFFRNGKLIRQSLRTEDQLYIVHDWAHHIKAETQKEGYGKISFTVEQMMEKKDA